MWSAVGAIAKALFGAVIGGIMQFFENRRKDNALVDSAAGAGYVKGNQDKDAAEQEAKKAADEVDNTPFDPGGFK